MTVCSARANFVAALAAAERGEAVVSGLYLLD